MPKGNQITVCIIKFSRFILNSLLSAVQNYSEQMFTKIKAKFSKQPVHNKYSHKQLPTCKMPTNHKLAEIMKGNMYCQYIWRIKVNILRTSHPITRNCWTFVQ